MRKVLPSAQHLAFRADAIELLRKHIGHLDGKELLALSAHLVGQVIALQDQRTMTREMAFEIVMVNIEQGNQDVMEELLTKTAGSG